ncbi:ATP-binding protein [Bifidobacterium sp. ESL0790]|uniref:ATP-binding protein n=1 Tax=Bifidobacterium sp. ESL0790 TaxID=2983233 RepID=UPI0023F6CA14|nr:ATP-binding protein [Bifidobacterium sp. ESL0790]WEV72644.1 ATP-binding protein [Bifidobacterium sp. ESL0790]
MTVSKAQHYVARPDLLKKLEEFRNTPAIKVLIGVRRCGKSTVLQMFSDSLRAKGVPESNLFYRRFDSFDTPIDYDAAALYDDLKKAMDNASGDYPMTVMLDEIQDIDGWEKIVRRLHTRDNTDVYITGSNANLLSSDLATYLTGRYVEIPVYPLSFKEYCAFSKADEPNLKTASTSLDSMDSTDSNDSVARSTTTERLFNEFLRFGGMPGLFALKTRTTTTVGTELQSIYDSIVFKDVAQHNNIRNLGVLEKVSRFLFATSGSLFSTRKVVNTLKSAGESISTTSLNSYVEGLEKAFLVYRAEQTDIQGKAMLRPLSKFYPVDVGFRNLTADFSSRDLGARLECVVYMELRRRGYSVSIGTGDNTEIDFIATKNDMAASKKMYIQVTASMLEETTSQRELAPLLKLTDAFPRIVITLDSYSAGTTPEGITIVNALDWLLR